MAKNNKNTPFYYEGELPAVGAKIVIKFYPDTQMTDIEYIEGDKMIGLAWYGSSLNGAAAHLADKAHVEIYDVVLREED